MTPEQILTERCDRCGARAITVTLHQSGELYWCGHHWRENQLALENDQLCLTEQGC